ncbi:prepilin peptidase [Pseudomonas typographi]|uniref:Prepilin leader peptidase/N-methyltransferase n=1 Tax=Pseudomonas typographi TaxID=2715964 RepID=A0ABR7YXK2_9PSED|nr:A24 family peptidase [Pseudomonas typographi]MBD1551010.1 prepilin peptidase [Pseudomonas typographi]MBD1587924.1 prepilin peptidase [Pseudomonas typographi]MBD1597912.1 prepilin peptidase [Pseudomonas typographi]
MPAFDLLASSALATALCALLLGLLVGSFLNVVIHRLPTMLDRQWRAQAREYLQLPADAVQGRYDLLLPASSCPHCGHHIRAYENIPVLSYLLLRGRCSGCQARISRRYPLVELACGVLSGFIGWHFGFSWQGGAFLLFTWGLLALAMIDADTQLLPDVIVLPLLWLGLVVNAFGVFTPLAAAVWGAVLGYGALWAVFWLFRLATGKQGMGYGDFKLLAAIGAWGGWQALPLTLLLSSLVGALLGLATLRLRGAKASTPLPFGPYLAVAGWIALLWGDEITTLYLQFAGFR